MSFGRRLPKNIARIARINFPDVVRSLRIPWMTSASVAQQCVVEIASGTVLIRNANTTIGYCRFTPVGDIEYIFVNPMYRRRGHGSRLLEEVRSTTGNIGRPLEPISPLGRQFFDSYPTPKGAATRPTETHR
jgi:GNAT superfamily N-acetyltransferase